jgi:hypothetical protein
MSNGWVAVVMLTTVVFGAMGLAWALDCEGRLVSLGPTPWDVDAIWGSGSRSKMLSRSS